MDSKQYIFLLFIYCYNKMTQLKLNNTDTYIRPKILYSIYSSVSNSIYN